MRSERRRGERATRSGPPTRTTSAATSTILVSAALAVAVLVLYAQTARFEFVSLDDYEVLVYRPLVRNGLSAEGVRWALTAVQPNWHPVTWLSHMLDFSVFGADAGAQHLVNASLHAVNAALLFLALQALSGTLWPSALVAALFALHPLRVESVAWVTERKDVLSGLFWMLTLLAYARYARRPSVKRYALVAIAVALGLMAKTMLVSLPIVLLLLDFWPLHRWHPAGVSPPAAPIARLVIEKLPLVVLALAASALTVFTLQAVRGVRSLDQVTLGWRLVNTPLAYVTYLVQTLWPTRMAAMYPHPALIGAPLADYVWPAALAALLLAAISTLCLVAATRHPYLVVGWLWYLVTLVPVIGLLQVGMQAHADRFTYVPLIGIYIMLAWGLRDVIARWPRLRRPGIAASALALAALAVLSWRQIGTWRNSRGVFEHAIAVTEGNYYAHQALGAVLRESGQLDAARSHLEEGLRIRPSEPYAHQQLGLVLEAQGNIDAAVAQYERAVELDPEFVQAHGNLGVVRLRQDKLDDAETHLRTALQLNPGYALAYTNLGAALLKQSRWEEAAAVLQQAVALDPNAADAHNNLGVALVRLGRLQEAGTQFELTLRLKPDHANAARSLAYVREQSGSR